MCGEPLKHPSRAYIAGMGAIMRPLNYRRDNHGKFDPLQSVR